MIFYSNKNQLTEFNEFKYFNQGNCANVYKYDDIVLKIYKQECIKQLKIKKNMFELLKKIDAPSIVKLQNYYYSRKTKLNALMNIDAYTMKLVNRAPIKLIDCDRKFLIEIFKKLEETIRLLNEYDIVLEDINSKNIILNENGITILDPDQFFKRSIFYKCNAYRLNKIIIIGFINSVLTNQLYDKEKKFVYFFITENEEKTLTDDVISSLTEDTFYESMKKN